MSIFVFFKTLVYFPALALNKVLLSIIFFKQVQIQDKFSSPYMDERALDELKLEENI